MCLCQTVINAEIIITHVLKYNVLEVTIASVFVLSVQYLISYKINNEILTDIINFSELTVDLDSMNQNLINQLSLNISCLMKVLFLSQTVGNKIQCLFVVNIYLKQVGLIPEVLPING